MIHCGDCLDAMRGMEPNSVDAIVTDPPYALTTTKRWATDDNFSQNQSDVGRRFTKGFMGKEWDGRLPGTETWTEVLRVAKPGCHLLAFGGTRTFHRLACAIEDAGWEIRDTLMWVYGSGFPKSHNLKGEHEGWGTALKPAWEPIILARKPLEGTVVANVQKWGCGSINIDGCRVGEDGGTTRTNGSNAGKPRNTLHGGNFGVSALDKGRWPANLLHDGSEEVLELFPNSSITGNRCIKNRVQQSMGSTPFMRGQDAPEYTDSGSAARFFYCAKASRAEREAGCEGMEEKHVTCRPLSDDEDDRTIQERLHGRKARNHHPCVKPLALMRYLCRLVTPPNGIILDPFMGSGTTGMAAKIEGFRFIGIEKEKEYCEIARKRINGITTQNDDLQQDGLALI